MILFYAVLTSSVLSILVGGLLWQKKQPNTYAQRFLSGLLLLYGYIGFISSLVINGTILQVPHFFRTAAPLYYISGPLLYLYVRSSLRSETRFDWRYSWLFLPAVLNFIEFIPFYAQSAAYKTAHLKALAFTTTQNSLTVVREGWAPASFHPIGYTLSGLIYAILAGVLLRNYLRGEGKSKLVNPVYRDWIKAFVLIQLVANIVWTLNMFLVRDTPYFNYTINSIYVITQFTICIYIIQRPALLYGVYWLNRKEAPVSTVPDRVASAVLLKNPVPIAPVPAKPEKAEAGNGLRKGGVTGPSEADVQEKLQLLEQYMVNQKPYLQPRLSLADVSVATNIPPYLLSSVLNGVLGVDFRDYVNEQRVRHLCTLLQRGDYGHLTLEGIGMEAGFSSKTTFYRAFQKHTGLTPHQYALQNGPEGSEPQQA
ncbi:helix-turn-helix domain-containing protein [Spirosoma rigui]|uniref:helix-turn-helix domain-containing protein n=1 Tax=Spirosoma rigui TaxID=564064 RepID=UPI0009B12698|nr:helix-turn-helix transcriptional regulator [Spirosoma rigui]